MLYVLQQTRRLLARISNYFKRTEKECSRNATSEKAPFLLMIPDELLLLIVGYLGITDRVDHTCLALTCKTLYHKLGPSIFASPRTFSLGTCWRSILRFVYGYEHFSHERFQIDRKQFLVRLRRDETLRFMRDKYLQHKSDEPQRWPICYSCRMFHPVSVFPHGAISTRRMKNAGVVELCPCIKLTLRRKVRLIQYLKLLQSNQNMANPSCDYLGPSLGSIFNIGNQINLRHQCAITDHPVAHSGIKTSAHLGDGDRLVIRTTYTLFNFSTGLYKLYRIFYDHYPLTIVIGPGEYTHTNKNLCPLCVALDEPHDREPSYRAEYQCMRDLGITRGPQIPHGALNVLNRIQESLLGFECL